MKKLNLDIQRFSSTNKTTNYELPQFIGTDKPTWLGDFNEAMSAIDSGMHENATDISSMASDVATASATASQASQDVTALTSTVNTLSGNVTTATTTANNAQSTATTALNTANTANGKADTNASAITTINSDISTLQTNVSNLAGKILWTNPNPDTTFNAQTMTLSSSDYDIYEVFFHQTDGDPDYRSERSVKGHGITLNAVLQAGNARRIIHYTNETTLTAENAGIVGTNNNAIPIMVVGYKTGIFS